jgi:hypothetical protein
VSTSSFKILLGRVSEMEGKERDDEREREGDGGKIVQEVAKEEILYAYLNGIVGTLSSSVWYRRTYHFCSQ